jgi:hypothetical protein
MKMKNKLMKGIRKKRSHLHFHGGLKLLLLFCRSHLCQYHQQLLFSKVLNLVKKNVANGYHL